MFCASAFTGSCNQRHILEAYSNLNFLPIHFHVVNKEINPYSGRKFLIKHIGVKSLDKARLSNRTISQHKNLEDKVKIRHVVLFGPVSSHSKTLAQSAQPSLLSVIKKDGGPCRESVATANSLIFSHCIEFKMSRLAIRTTFNCFGKLARLNGCGFRYKRTLTVSKRKKKVRTRLVIQ